MENGEGLDALRSNPTISTTTTTEGCALCDFVIRGYDVLQ